MLGDMWDKGDVEVGGKWCLCNGVCFQRKPIYFFYFFLFKIYLQLTVNKKKYLAYLKTMLIYFKKSIKNINIS